MAADPPAANETFDPEDTVVMAHELEVAIPGSFVVLQGSPGDGMSNTIDSLPLLPEYNESVRGDAQDGQDSDTPSRDNGATDTSDDANADANATANASTNSGSSHPGSNLFAPADANLTAQQRLDEQSLQEWKNECRATERQQRLDWKHSFENQYYRQQADGSGSINSMIESRTDRDAMWWQIDGRLALLRTLPNRLSSGVVVRTSLGTLSPGSTLIATEIVHLSSVTLKRVAVPPTHTSYNGGEPQQSIYPRGREGVVQMLKIVSSASSRMTAYVTLSVDGYPLMAPGIPALYVDPNVWIWRVTCPVGAFVRLGLELKTKHVDTIPYGSLIRVTRKTVNTHGLSRLRVQSIVDDIMSPQRTARMVDGWCSEFLNPLSGQRGSVAQPLSFPVPALYRVRLAEGAVIRRDVELSSPQIGHAPYGAELSIIGRAFSEHPMDRCIERLQLAGNGGWISVRLNRPPPEDEMVVDFVSLDPSFDPTKPGLFHLETQRQVEEYIQEALAASSADGEGHDSDTVGTGRNNGNTTQANGDTTQANGDSRRGNDASTDDLDVLSLSGKVSIKASTTMNANAAHSGSSRAGQRRQMGRSNLDRSSDDDRCLICLSEERNATIVHGETGHVACCLVCARILKARGDKCPVCRFEIDLIIQHFWA